MTTLRYVCDDVVASRCALISAAESATERQQVRVSNLQALHAASTAALVTALRTLLLMRDACSVMYVLCRAVGEIKALVVPM